jgi:CBS domain-containing protein
MKLAELIKGKHKEIVKIRDDSKIAMAASTMTEAKIGALLVEDGAGEIVGILSERDIVRGMGPHGADLHDVKVSELMTRNLIRCAPDDTVNEAMAMMTDRRIRHLPVFDGEALVGFISIGDLVKCRIMEVQSEAESLRQYILS